MAKVDIIEERKKEIIDHITVNDLEVATNRVMDFAKDFSNREKINESIIYKQRYNYIG